MNNNLTLKCTVSKVVYLVSIEDPFGVTKAQCIPALTCLKLQKNGTDLQKSELILRLPLKTKDRKLLTGIWSCRHGFNSGVAKTAISFIGVERKYIL